MNFFQQVYPVFLCLVPNNGSLAGCKPSFKIITTANDLATLQFIPHPEIHSHFKPLFLTALIPPFMNTAEDITPLFVHQREAVLTFSSSFIRVCSKKTGIMDVKEEE
jgi:hypothetical protein